MAATAAAVVAVAVAAAAAMRGGGVMVAIEEATRKRAAGGGIARITVGQIFRDGVTLALRWREGAATGIRGAEVGGIERGEPLRKRW